MGLSLRADRLLLALLLLLLNLTLIVDAFAAHLSVESVLVVGAVVDNASGA